MAASDDDLLISVSTDVTTIKRQLKQLGQDINQTTSGIQKQFETVGRTKGCFVFIGLEARAISHRLPRG